jgi:hypothetical protein
MLLALTLEYFEQGPSNRGLAAWVVYLRSRQVRDIEDIDGLFTERRNMRRGDVEVQPAEL